MTIALSYNDDLSRVQIAVTDLPFETGTIRIERSTNELFWQTVRGASELPVTGNAASVDDYEFAADVENFYRATSLAPVYLGAADNDTVGSDPAVAPSVDPPAAGLMVCAWTSFDFIGIYALPGSMTETVQQQGTQFASNAVATEAVSSGATGTRSATAGQVDQWSAASVVVPGSAITIEDTGWDYQEFADPASVTTAAAQVGWWVIAVVGVDIDPSDVTPDPSGGGWSRVADSGATGGASRTVVWAREVTTAGPVTVDFDTTLGDDVFLTVLLVSGVEPVVETDSITPDLQGQVWFKWIKYALLNRPLPVTDWSPITRVNRGTTHQIAGRSVPVAVTDIRGSQSFTIDVATRDLVDETFDPLVEARDIDLALAEGGILFIHVPADSPVPGGYVTVGDTTQRPAPSRRAGVTSEIWTLPCTVVAPPGPGVVGTTLTWGTVLNLYGDWNALLAANPTWADLLATVGSPEDLVVL